MKGTFTKDKIYIFFLCLIAFAIPFPFIYSSISIILLLTVWVFTTDFKKTLRLFYNNKYLWFWCLLFFLTAVSYFYSFDKILSINDLQRKLSFFILPFIIGTKLNVNKNTLNKIFSCFIAGLLIVIIFCFVSATIRWQHSKDIDVFFYHNLVAGLNANAVYYALYIYFALVLLLLYSWEGTIFKNKWLFTFSLSLLIIFFILLSSKSLLLLFFILVLPIFLIRTLKKHKLVSLIIIVLGFSTICGIFFTKNPIHKRYQEILENNDKENWLPEYANGQKQHFNNLTLRRFLWSTALENIKENNLWLYGCGNGSVLELQKQKIQKKIVEYGSDNQLINTNPPLWDYNLHNMYLQILMMLGFPGLCTFLVLLIAPIFFIKYNEEKRVYYLYFISIIIFMFQESAFQTQAGIVYCTYFYMVIYSYINSTSQKEKEE